MILTATPRSSQEPVFYNLLRFFIIFNSLAALSCREEICCGKEPTENLGGIFRLNTPEGNHPILIQYPTACLPSFKNLWQSELKPLITNEGECNISQDFGASQISEFQLTESRSIKTACGPIQIFTTPKNISSESTMCLTNHHSKAVANWHNSQTFFNDKETANIRRSKQIYGTFLVIFSYGILGILTLLCCGNGPKPEHTANI